MNRQYQLVLQFPEECPLESMDFEDDIAAALSNPLGNDTAPHIVDGNSVGAGTCEFFIHTDDPQDAFDVCKPLLESAGLLSWVVAAHRRYVEDDYEEFVVIWPHGYTGEFAV